MTIRLICGEPGEGKSYYAVYCAYHRMKTGRPVFSTFAIRGARHCMTIADVLCDEFAESDFICDEAGLEFSNRKTSDYDEMVHLAFTQHRKSAADIDLIVQDLGYLELNIKRVAAEVVLVSRVGPSGEGARRSLKPVHFWQRPWAFRAEWFRPKVDFDDGWALKATAEPYRTKFIPFRQRYADMYSSFERVVPLELRARVAELEAGAALRASLPPYKVERGRLVHQELPEGFSELTLPRKVSPKGGKGPRIATLHDEDLQGQLESAGYVVGGAPGPDLPALEGVVFDPV